MRQQVKLVTHSGKFLASIDQKRYFNLKIDHVAIAVDDIEKYTKTYQEVFDVKNVEYETVESEGVKVAILHLDNANIELLEPINDSSPIKKFLEKRGSGLHHIALETKNIEDDVVRMEGCGIQFLGNIRPGSAGTKVTFIHPKSLSGVLTELCSKPEI